MPLPGTIKNNSLALISILFLEVFAAPPTGCGASDSARTVRGWDSTHSFYMWLRGVPDETSPRPNSSPPCCKGFMKTPAALQPLIDDGVIDEVIRSLKSGKEATVYLVRSGRVSARATARIRLRP